MEEKRNPCERWSQSRKSANFAIEGLEKEWPCARHLLHVAHWRRQAAPEEGHLAKPARQPPLEVEEAAEADRTARRGREATGSEEEEGPRPIPSSARGTHTETPLEAKTTECGTLPATEPTGRPKDDKTHPEDGPEKRSQEPNLRNSFT